MEAFQGAKRRFQILAWQPFMVVDDYAHHPTEVRATLEAARSLGRTRVVAIFQPHRYTRTKYFIDEFVTAFTGADVVLLDDIFAASEPPLPGVSSETLAEGIASHNSGQVEYLPGKDAILSWVQENWRPGDIYLTMGAGDISQVGKELAQICQAGLAGNGLIDVE